jgi:hypothetical protein
MKGDKSYLAPIMMQGDLLKQFTSNAYNKPATGLNILRETIMGRELFDFAFRQYAQRWMFKHPTPEDFFRTMELASGNPAQEKAENRKKPDLNPNPLQCSATGPA